MSAAMAIAIATIIGEAVSAGMEISLLANAMKNESKIPQAMLDKLAVDVRAAGDAWRS